MASDQLAHINHNHVEQAYARWAPFYDAAFEAILKPGRLAATAAASGVGRRILDVGVGTGLELAMFSKGARIIGVDLSEQMLRIARKRVAKSRLGDVDGLVRGDAMNLPFADAAFDCAVAPYVLTVVPDPRKTLDELARVVRAGGEIVLVNHIGAESGPIAWIEGALGKISKHLGWRPEFPWDVIGDWIAARGDMRLVERRALAPLKLFTLARIERL